VRRCPRCGRQTAGRICGACGFARPFAWERGTFLTGQTVIYEERPYLIVRQGVHPPKGSVYDWEGERWWVLDPERGGLVCADEADFEGRPLGKRADEESVVGSGGEKSSVEPLEVRGCLMRPRLPHAVHRS
jgi:hypothetical protein